MEIKLKFDLEIEGALSEDRAREVFKQYLLRKLDENVITSESITANPDDDSYAIIVNGWELIEE